MACEHIQLPDGGTAIICGLRRGKQKTQKCRFCGSAGVKLCDWPTEKPVKIAHHELSPEDTVVTVQHKYRLKVQGLQRFEVDSALKGCPPSPVVITMYGLVFPDGRCWLYYHWGVGFINGAGAKGSVNVLRPGTCDSPCCDLHSREVGEDKDYCMEHWRAWEEMK